MSFGRSAVLACTLALVGTGAIGLGPSGDARATLRKPHCLPSASGPWHSTGGGGMSAAGRARIVLPSPVARPRVVIPGHPPRGARCPG